MNEFRVPDGVYLLNHSVGALTHRSLRARDQAFEFWAAHGSKAWPNWMQFVDAFKNSLAQLFNTKPTSICPQTNVSAGLAKIVSCLPPAIGSRKKILVGAEDFPTVGFVLSQLSKLGYSIEFVESSQTNTDAWYDRLNSDVVLAHFSHSSFGASKLLDVQVLCERAKQSDTIVIVDICQSAGVVPIDLSTWQADFVLGSSVKWLCGGPGAGYLWVNEASVESWQPRDVGWHSHEQPLDFNIKDFRYANSANRFLGGTPSVWPFTIASESIKLLVEFGIENIRAHNLRLTEMLMVAANELKVSVMTPATKWRGGTVTIDFPDSKNYVEAFAEKWQIHTDFRPGYGHRFSPHIYNSESDIKTVIDALQGLCR